MKNQKPRKVENGVKGVGTPRCNPSPGRVISRPQGRPDRHHATEAINVKKNIRVGTLESAQEMTRLDINILGLCETRWKNSGDFKHDDHRMIYSGGITHRRGVGLLLDEECAKCVQGYWQLSERVLLVKLEGKPINLSIIVVYAPTSDSEEAEIDEFYEQLDKA